MNNYVIYYTTDNGKVQLRSHFAADTEAFNAFLESIPSHQRIHYAGVTLYQNIPEELLAIDESTGKTHAELFIELMNTQYDV